MPGKTISAYTDEETAKLVADLARVEHRKPSQIAAAALAFYVRLPPEAHAALRRLEASDSEGHLNLMRREVTRAISNASYHAAIARMAPRVREIYRDRLDTMTDEEILAEAVRLTSGDMSTGGSHAR
jgi:predicted transcriptional regulator